MIYILNYQIDVPNFISFEKIIIIIYNCFRKYDRSGAATAAEQGGDDGTIEGQEGGPERDARVQGVWR